MNLNKLVVGTVALLIASAAVAGGPPTVPLGTTLGRSLGVTLGQVLGFSLGSDLPLANIALLTVAAVSLAVGIGIVRRKKSH